MKINWNDFDNVVIKHWLLDEYNLIINDIDIIERRDGDFIKILDNDDIYHIVFIIKNIDIYYYSPISDKFEDESFDLKYQAYVRKHKLKRILDIEI